MPDNKRVLILCPILPGKIVAIHRNSDNPVALQNSQEEKWLALFPWSNLSTFSIKSRC